MEKWENGSIICLLASCFAVYVHFHDMRHFCAGGLKLKTWPWKWEFETMLYSDGKSANCFSGVITFARLSLLVCFFVCCFRYSTSLFDTWTETVGESSQFNLSLPLIKRDPDTQLITVNFNPQVYISLHTVRNADMLVPFVMRYIRVVIYQANLFSSSSLVWSVFQFLIEMI